MSCKLQELTTSAVTQGKLCPQVDKEKYVADVAKPFMRKVASMGLGEVKAGPRSKKSLVFVKCKRWGDSIDPAVIAFLDKESLLPIATASANAENVPNSSDSS